MASTMAKKRKQDGGGSQDPHKYRVLSLRPPDDIRAAVEALAEEDQRTVSQMTLILLKEALASRGRLPGKEKR
jgi:hypothetical protein